MFIRYFVIFRNGCMVMNDRKMKILLITSVDITTKSGGGFANRAFYDSLTLHFPECVDVIPFVPSTLVEKVSFVLHARIHRLHTKVLNFLDRNKGAYQICIINSGLYGDLVPEIKKRGIRVVMIHHNFEPVFQKDNKRPVTLWGLTSFFVSRNERKAYRYSDLNIFLSDYDRKMMVERYGTSNKQHDAVVGIYEPINHSSLFLQSENDNSYIDVAMSGCLNHQQTIVGLKDFVKKYFRIFKKIMPAASRLIITGSTPGKSVNKYARENDIRIVPDPERISDVIKDCSIYLCPVNVGSGVKLRILDGLRLGMPILAHKVSSRGYEAFINKPWFAVYDDIESFEKGLNSILLYLKNNNNFRTEIIREYKAQFSFEAGDERFYAVLKSILP